MNFAHMAAQDNFAILILESKIVKRTPMATEIIFSLHFGKNARKLKWNKKMSATKTEKNARTMSFRLIVSSSPFFHSYSSHLCDDILKTADSWQSWEKKGVLLRACGTIFNFPLFPYCLLQPFDGLCKDTIKQSPKWNSGAITR